MKDNRQARQSITEQTSEAIKSMITTRELIPGQVVVERDLAEKLGTSRAPVREALVELEMKGLVKRIGPRTRIVVEMTLQDIVEIYQLREMMEGMAARLLATRVGGALLDELRGLAAAVDAVQLPDTSDELDFHATILRECGNARLAQLAYPLNTQLPGVRFHELVTQTASIDVSHRPESRVTHTDIIEAIASGDQDKAESVARMHIREAKDRLVREWLGTV